MQRIFVWPSKNWALGASDQQQQKTQKKKMGITRPCPDGEVLIAL